MKKRLVSLLLSLLMVLTLIPVSALALGTVNITEQPKSQTVQVGDTATFTVQASYGDKKVMYLWFDADEMPVDTLMGILKKYDGNASLGRSDLSVGEILQITGKVSQITGALLTTETDSNSYTCTAASDMNGMKVQCLAFCTEDNKTSLDGKLVAYCLSDAVTLTVTHQHIWGTYKSNGDATCVKDGTKTAKCTVDGCTATNTVADADSHSNGAHSYGAWTKLNDTQHRRVCKNDANHVETADHVWGVYVSNGDATCTADGTKTAKCLYCDATNTVTDAGTKLEHSFTQYVSDGNATCGKDGTKTAKCDYAGCTATDTVTDADSHKSVAHSWNSGEVTKAATCTEAGTMTYTCTVDGCGATKAVDIPALHHNYGEWTKLDDTQHRRVCKNDKTHVETADHVWGEYVSNGDATCTADGTKTAKCLYCDATNTVTDAGTKLEHSFTRYVSDGNATCAKDGTKTAKCDHAGCTATDTVTDADSHKSVAHSWNNGEVTKAATTTEKGEKTYTCTVCGAAKKETIAQLKLSTPKLSSVTNDTNGVKVTWGKVAGAARYRVFYKVGNGGWKKFADTGATSLIVTGLKSGTKYSFTVRCLSADGKSYTSGYDTVGKSITYKPVTLRTPAISSVANAAGGVKVTWGKVTGAGRYRVYYKTGSGSWKKFADTTATSMVVTGLKSGTKYSFTVRCMHADGSGFASGYSATGKSITYIAQPTISSVANTASGVKVTWGKVTGAAKYRVFYKADGGSWKKFADTTATNLTVTGLTSGSVYRFTVRCLSADSKSYTSSYSTTGKSITFIAQPVISKVSNANGGVTVVWNEVPGAAQYRVYYKPSGGSWKKAGDSLSNYLIVTGLTSGTTYSFTVRCMNEAGTSFTSTFDAAGKTLKYLAMPVLGDAAVSGANVSVSWSKVAGADGYYVYRKAANAGGWTRIKTISSGTTLSCTDTPAKNQTWLYTVKAYSGSTVSAFDASGVSALVTPEEPNFKVTMLNDADLTESNNLLMNIGSLKTKIKLLQLASKYLPVAIMVVENNGSTTLRVENDGARMLGEGEDDQKLQIKKLKDTSSITSSWSGILGSGTGGLSGILSGSSSGSLAAILGNSSLLGSFVESSPSKLDLLKSSLEDADYVDIAAGESEIVIFEIVDGSVGNHSDKTFRYEISYDGLEYVVTSVGSEVTSVTKK